MSNRDSDKQLFRDLYGDIEPIKDDKAQPWKKHPSPRPRHKESPENNDRLDISPYPEIHTEQTDTKDDYHYRANGIQDKQINKLRRGKIPPQATLDLHGMTRESALPELQEFVSGCQQQGLKCIHVIHGKGYRSEAGKPVLKPSVANWLRQMATVLAYCPAPAYDGGDGALYVLLKTLRE